MAERAVRLPRHAEASRLPAPRSVLPDPTILDPRSPASLLTPAGTTRNRRQGALLHAFFPTRRLYSAALTSLSLATPALGVSGPRHPKLPCGADPGPDHVTAVTTLDADETRRQLEDVLKAYPPSLPPDHADGPDPAEQRGLPAAVPGAGDVPGPAPGDRAQSPAISSPSTAQTATSTTAETPQDRAIDMWRSTIEGFTIGTVILAIASGVIWLVKTLIDHRRWSRLSKIQTEVHNKVLDRCSSNEDLLAYIQTPAGRRFLESAPIPMESPRAIGGAARPHPVVGAGGRRAHRARPRHHARVAHHARRSRAAARRDGCHRRSRSASGSSCRPSSPTS